MFLFWKLFSDQLFQKQNKVSDADENKEMVMWCAFLTYLLRQIEDVQNCQRLAKKDKDGMPKHGELSLFQP